MKKTALPINATSVNTCMITKKLEGLTLGELAEGYADNSDKIEGGVYAWNGILNLRPKFQRSSIRDTDTKWKAELVRSVINSRPIGVMYFGEVLVSTDMNDVHTQYLDIDGQQRLISLCAFINGEYSLPFEYNGKCDMMLFNDPRISDEVRNRILKYEPYICVCKGDNDALLDWFITINQPISELTKQELRNAAFNGKCVESAKTYFSNAKANMGDHYYNDNHAMVMHKESEYYYDKYTLSLSPERQDVLEMVYDWIGAYKYEDLRDNTEAAKCARIERYMAESKDYENADEMFDHYVKVIDWIIDNGFDVYGKATKKPDWGMLYAKYHDTPIDKEAANARIYELLADEEVCNQKNIFEYVILGCPEDKDQMLQPKNFKEVQKTKQIAKQNYLDPITHERLTKPEAHHIIAWRQGGKTTEDNIIVVNQDTHKAIHNGVYTTEQVREALNNLLNELK